MNLHTYKNYIRMGVGRLVIIATLIYPFSSPAAKQDELKCNIQNGECILTPIIYPEDKYFPGYVIYDPSREAYDLNHTGKIKGTFYKTNNQYYNHFSSTVSLNDRNKAYTVNITGSDTIDFTYFEDIASPGKSSTSLFGGAGLNLNINNNIGKDVNIKGLDIKDNDRFSLNFQGPIYYGKYKPSATQILHMSTHIKNPTANSTNYSLYAKNSNVYIENSAYFYSTELKDKTKYGVYLDNSLLYILTNLNEPEQVTHFSNLVNKNSKLKLNINLLTKNDININNADGSIDKYEAYQTPSINFAYSKNTDRQGPDNFYDTMNYYGTITNIGGKKLNIEYLEECEFMSQTGEVLKPSQAVQIDKFFASNPKPILGSKYKFQGGKYTLIANLKLENGNKVFDYIDVGQPDKYNQNLFTTNRVFLTEEKIYIY